MDNFPDLHHYRPDELKPLLKKGINLLDLRSTADFCDGFIPDAVFVPDSWMKFGKLKGILQPEQKVVFLPGNDSEEVMRVFMAEQRDLVEGVVDGGFESWRDAGNELDVVISVDAEELGYEIRFGEPHIVDMRLSEKLFDEQHIIGAEYIPANDLLDRFTELPYELSDTVYLYDEDGEGALAVISYLKKRGLHFFYHLKGGFQAAVAAGLPMEVTVQKK